MASWRCLLVSMEARNKKVGRRKGTDNPMYNKGDAMFEGLFQPMHVVVILVIVLIIFGPGKLPELGGSIGKAIRGFKKAMDEGEREAEAHSEAKKIEGKQG